MIKVKLPDGKIASFPDGTNPAQIETALAAYAKPSITAGNLTREALQGATFNFGDELRAGASAALGAATGQGGFSDLYDVTRDYERGQSAQFMQDHPVAAIGANIAGGLVPGVLGGAVFGASSKGAQLAQQAKNAGLLGRLGIAAKVGATGGGAAGALAGAGAAEEVVDIPIEAAKGGAIGGVAGGLLGAATEGGISAFRGGAEAIRRARDPAYQSARNVGKAVQRSGYTPEEALARAKAMGPDGTLADVADSAQDMLESVTNQPGAARGLALRQLEERSRNQGGQLLSTLGPGKKYETLSALQDYRKKVAAPLYRDAFKKGVPHTPTLEKIFSDVEDYAPGLWGKAKKLGKLRLANQGDEISADALGDARPSLQGWQYVKEKLDDMVDSMYRSGDNKAAEAVKDVRGRLLNELDWLNTDYKKARGAWAGSKQFEEKMGEAGKFMTTPAAEFENLVKGLTPIDREAVKVGAIQAIEDRIERGAWTQDVAKFFRTPAMARKMKALFNDAKEYADFTNKLTASTAKQKTFDAVRGNSATAKRLAGAADSNDWISAAMQSAVDLATNPASVVSVAKRGLLYAGNKAAGVRPSMSEAARAETARTLLQTDPAMRALALKLQSGLLNAPLPPAQFPLLPGNVGLLSGQLAALTSSK